MKKDSKILVAGSSGLVGSAIVRQLLAKGYTNITGAALRPGNDTASDIAFHTIDFLDQQAVSRLFAQQKPEYVFVAAARVGGIVANNRYRADFIYQNLQIQNNLIHNSYEAGAKKLLFLGSSCIYPKHCPQPMKENYLLTDKLEYTNEPYAIAKIAGIKMCESYNLQYNTNFISVMPTNLYGPHDNFDLEKSHVLPALMRKMHLGKCLLNNDMDAIRKDFDANPVEKTTGKASDQKIIATLKKYGIERSETGKTSITLWGTGTPRREFLHSNDLASACVFLMENADFKDIVQHSLGTDATEIRNTHINIGTGKDLTIKELSEIIKEVTGFGGQIEWDAEKPDGTPRKLLDVSKLSALGWTYSIDFRQSLNEIYKHYLQQ